MCRILLTLLVVVAIVSAAQARKDRVKKAKDCSRPCPRILTPVCGSDRVSYSNMCAFRNAQCLAVEQGQKLLLQYEGECGKPKPIKKAKVSKVNNNGRRKEKNRGQKRPKRCRPDTTHCKTINSTRNAVCDSNGTTHSTYCHFKVAQCKAALAGQNLSLRYKGVCGKPKRQVVCPQESQCDLKNRPICGEDEKTYRNLCLFLVAKCKAKKDGRRLKLKYRGACGNPTPRKSCPPRTCPKQDKPVCGSDGKTYTNGCELATAKCALPKGQKRQLTLKHRGPCGAPITAKPCMTKQKCRRKRDPVCGSDGVTYRSKCHLRVAKCLRKRKRRSQLVLKHMGPCGKLVNGIGK